MESNDQAQVIEIVARILKLPADKVGLDSSADNHDTWDSLAQVTLIMALEQEFDLELDVEEAMELTSVGAILEMLASQNAA